MTCTSSLIERMQQCDGRRRFGITASSAKTCDSCLVRPCYSWPWCCSSGKGAIRENVVCVLLYNAFTSDSIQSISWNERPGYRTYRRNLRMEVTFSCNCDKNTPFYAVYRRRRVSRLTLVASERTCPERDFS